MDTQILTNEETDLEDLYHGELRCEADHNPEPEYEVRPCSVKVVARKTVSCCSDTFFICKNSYDLNMEFLSTPGLICEDCDRRLTDCWRVVTV